MEGKSISIRDVVKTILEDLNSREKHQKSEILDFWEKIVGNKIKIHTRPYAFRSKKLFVKVDDSSWAFELSHRYKQSLLKKLQNEFGEKTIVDIYFRVGEL